MQHNDEPKKKKKKMKKKKKKTPSLRKQFMDEQKALLAKKNQAETLLEDDPLGIEVDPLGLYAEGAKNPFIAPSVPDEVGIYKGAEAVPFDDGLGTYRAGGEEKEEPEIMQHATEKRLLKGTSISMSVSLTDSSSSIEWNKGDRKSVDLTNGRRIDKRDFKNMKHTIIVSSHKGVDANFYELMGKLDSKEVKALRSQTLLYYQAGQKIILGKGSFGLVRLVKASDGTYLAVKKIAEPKEFRNESLFLMLMKKEKIKGFLPITDTITVESSKDKLTTYQIMPIANLGSGRDLFKKMDRFGEAEREIIARYLTLTFIDIFAGLEKKGIYHTDFKIDNLLLNFSLNGVDAYLSDFGAGVHFSSERGQPDLIVGLKSDALYFPPEKLTVGHGIKTVRDVYRMQEAWRLGLTLLLYINPNLGIKYTQTAMSLLQSQTLDASKMAGYKEWLNAFEELHKELKESLAGEILSPEISELIIGFLEPHWQNRLTIKEAKNRLTQARKNDLIHDVSQKELGQVFGALLKIKALETIQGFAKKRERKSGLKHFKRVSAKDFEKKKKEWRKQEATFFNSPSSRDSKEKEAEKPPKLRKGLSLQDFKLTAGEFLQKMSPRSPNDSPRSEGSPSSSKVGSQIKGFFPRRKENETENSSPRKPGSLIKGHSPRKESDPIKGRSEEITGIRFHDKKEKRKSEKNSSVSPTTPKPQKKGQ